MIAVWRFLTMPRICLQFVVVVFSDHTHYFCSLFLCNTLCSFWFWKNLDWVRIAGCFALIIFLMTCDCNCSITLFIQSHGFVSSL